MVVLLTSPGAHCGVASSEADEGRILHLDRRLGPLCPQRESMLDVGTALGMSSERLFLPQCPQTHATHRVTWGKLSPPLPFPPSIVGAHLVQERRSAPSGTHPWPAVLASAWQDGKRARMPSPVYADGRVQYCTVVHTHAATRVWSRPAAELALATLSVALLEVAASEEPLPCQAVRQRGRERDTSRQCRSVRFRGEKDQSILYEHHAVL
jgi:hypothetical protein